jgi:hypothetical protein
MPSQTKKENIELLPRAIVTNKVRNCSNDPLVIKKCESSKKIIEKYGFPKEILDLIKKYQEEPGQK